ncbi:MAG: sulfotransferase [Acidobacteriota bacterium]
MRSIDAVVIDRPIFLLGNQGDGLTLLSRIIRRHPAVVSVTGGPAYWSGACDLQNVMRPRLPASLALPLRAPAGTMLPSHLPMPHSWAYGCSETINHYRKTALDSDLVTQRVLRRVIGESLWRHGRPRGSGRFLDGSQTFTVKVSFIDALLRDTQPHFVLVTRDPYATCLRAAAGAAGDMRRYARQLDFDRRLALCAEHWAGCMSAALADAEAAERFFIVPIEQFTAQPEASLAGLLRFLGLHSVGDLLPAAHQTVPFGSRRADRWFPLRRDLNAPFLSSLQPHQAEIIHQCCGELASRLGYERPQNDALRKPR